MSQPLLNIAENAARSAAKIIMRSTDHINTLEVTEKGRHDYVTEVDKLAEQEIIRLIQRAHPSHTIIAEESGEHPGDADHVWIIDPLDGTTNFIHGFPHYSISIAYMNRGKIEAGVIFDPIRDEMFSAARGKGARMNDKRLRVSPQKKLDHALLGTGFPFKEKHHFKPYFRTFEAVFPNAAGVRRAGSAALDLAYVAAGRLDGFWEIKLNKWDMAAGVLLILEAGGLVGDFYGGETYLENGNIIAGNPKIFKQLLQLILPSLESIDLESLYCNL